MAERIQYYGTGRRKRAIACAFGLRPGSGEFSVNGRAFEEIFRDAGAAIGGEYAAGVFGYQRLRSTSSPAYSAAACAARRTQCS